MVGGWSGRSPEARTSTYTSWYRDGATVLNASATAILLSALPQPRSAKSESFVDY